MQSTSIRSLRLGLPALVALATLMTAAEASAGDFILSLGGSEQAITDDAWDYLSDDGFLSDSHLTVQVPVVDGVNVGLEYDWATETFDPYKDVSTTLGLDTLLVTSRFEHELFGFFAPYAYVGAGFTYAFLEASFDGDDREQSAWMFHGVALAGLEVHLPTDWVRKFFGIARGSYAEDLTAGFYFEGGYRLTTEASFDDLVRPEPDKKPDPEDLPLATSAIGVGSVDLSGVLLRSGLRLRF